MDEKMETTSQLGREDESDRQGGWWKRRENERNVDLLLLKTKQDLTYIRLMDLINRKFKNE
jgi:hypothetical protein